MHAIERPHLPRIGVLALGAVLLAIVVLLLAASRVGDIGLSSSSASSGASTAPPASIHSAPSAASSFGHRSSPSGKVGTRSENHAPAPFSYFELIAMRFTFDSTCGNFGMVTVSTPFLNAADIWS